jgi:hypothetical protein
VRSASFSAPLPVRFSLVGLDREQASLAEHAGVVEAMSEVALAFADFRIFALVEFERPRFEISD